MFNRTENVSRCTKCIVHNQRDVMLFCDSRYCFKIRNIELRISYCFEVDCFCIFIDGRFKIFGSIAVHKFHLNAQTLELHLELIIGATIDKGG